MSADRTCICEHDLIWHGIGTESRCRSQRLDGAGMQRLCHCQGFRRTVPPVVAGLDEGDLLSALNDIRYTLRRIEDTLNDKVTP